MARYCSLDVLPVELLHNIFSYFLGHEILLTFSDLSDYVTAVILNYSAYQWNFQSIRKSDFDQICRRIRPDQVVSLTLSDDNDTPGLSEVFLTRFTIQQFIHLRSLRLIAIEIDSLKSIFPHLHRLTQLRALSFNSETVRRKYPIQDNNDSTESTRLKSLLLQTYGRILPGLIYIDLNHSVDLIPLTLPYLRHLKLSTFSDDQLKIIFQKSLELKSLDIVLNMSTLNSKSVLPMNRLIRLKLKIENQRISRDELERLMTHVPHLKHLELDTLTFPDVANGHFLQRLVHSFLTFHFKFDALIIDIYATLSTFLTAFWLKEKRWFVGYLNGSLFSIPYFIPTHMTSSNLLSFRTTAPDHSFLSKYLHTLTVNAMYSTENKRLTNVKTLILTEILNFSCLMQLNIDFHRVEHLIVSSFDQLATMMPFVNLILYLTKLTIKKSITIQMIEQIRFYHLTQIRALELDKGLNEEIDSIIEKLFHIFPRLEQLRYKSIIKSVAMMHRFINGFPYLSNALFYGHPLFFRNPELITSNLQQGTHRRTICRIYHSTNTQRIFSIHWTIEKPVFVIYPLAGHQQSTMWQLAHQIFWLRSPLHQSWRANYCWHRLNYLFFSSY